MSPRTPLRLAFAALLLTAAALATSAASSAAATPGFAVTSAVSFEHVSLQVEGAITVEDGGALTLDGVDLWITSAPGAPAALIVKPGGVLTVRDSMLRSDAAGFRFEIYGKAEVRSTSVFAVASDPSVPLGRALDAGYRIAGGGVRVVSDLAVFEDVQVRGATGCGFSLQGAPSLVHVTVSNIDYRVAGSSGYAAAVCVVGGSPHIEGLTVSNIGAGAQGSATGLFAAALVADTPQKLTLTGLDAVAIAPALSGMPAAHTIAVFVQDPAFVTISGGRIRGLTEGIAMRGSSAPPEGGSVTIEALTIEATSVPVDVRAAYNADPNLLWSLLDITGCGSHGLYFESQAGGSAASVTATVANTTARSCGGAGIVMYDAGANAPHFFNAWDSNASQNGQQGFYLHGQTMGAGLNVQMANNYAWRNNFAGIVVEGNYATTATAKLASAKLEHNTARNNSLASSTWNGGIILNLGAPTTMSMRYQFNIATGNGAQGGSADYGHYIAVAVTQTLTFGNTFITGIISHSNGEYGMAIYGGTTIRFDQARISDSTIINHSTAGIYGYYARIEVWNSTMSNVKELEGQTTAFYLMGTVHNRLAGTTTGIFKIVSYKQICIHGQWQNGAPLYLIPLTFTSGAGTAAAMYSDVSVDPPIAAGGRQTDANGNWSGWALDWTFDPQAPAANQTLDYAPLTISVQLFETAAHAGPFDMITNICGPIEFVDPNPPFITVNSPRENGTYTTRNLTVQGTVTDDLSGLALLQVSLDGTNWFDISGPAGLFAHTFANVSEGIYDLRLRAWDRANDGLDPRNETLVILYSITIDTTAPQITLFEPPLQDGGEYWTSNDQIFFRGSVNGSVAALYINGEPIDIGTGTSFLFLGSLPNEGPQSFLFLAIDDAGNTMTLKVTIYKDKVVPTLIITKPFARGDIYVNSHNLEVEGITDPNVVVTVNGIVSLMSGTTFHADVVLAEGRNVINISAVDAAGNRASRALAVTSDTVAPTIDLTSHHTGDFLNSSRAEFMGTLTETVALFEVNLRIFDVPGQDFDAVLGLAEGENRISINATDRAGNRGHAEIRVTVDTVAPEMLLIGLLDFETRNTPVLQVVGTLNEAAVVTVDGDEVDVVTLQFDATVTLQEGANTIEFRATDAAGNRAIVLRHITLDTSQPTLTITEPKAGTPVNSRTVHVVGSSEPNSIIEVGSQLVQADATGKFSAWVDLQGDGAQVLSITVTDSAGNSVQESYTVTYAAPVTNTGGDMVLGLVLLAGLAGGLAVGSMFLARRRIDGEVEEARGKRQSADAIQQATPGYTEAAPDAGYYQPPPPSDAPPAPYDPNAYDPNAYDPNAQAPPAEGESAGAPPADQAPPPPRAPRAPRPPRPPST